MTKTERSPLLSVVVPVYNGEAYLSGTLDSILASEYRELEVILIDDGSEDKSGQICRAYAQSDARIRYIHTKNAGIVAARNRGMDAAAGEYICFCDQDDEVDARMYTLLIQKLQAENAQIGVCSTGRIMDGKKSPYESLTDNCCRGDGILHSLLYPLLFRGYNYSFYNKENYLYGTLWKCIFRVDFLKKHGMRFQRFVDYEDDWLFVTEALCHAKIVVTSSHTGYYWRVSTDSRSHQKRFIPDIGSRYKQLDDYVMKYLRDRITDRDILDAYHQIRLCEDYVDMLKKEPGTKKERKSYYIEVKDYLYASDYKKQLSCYRHLQPNAYRRRLTGEALLRVGVRGAFWANRFLTAGEHAAGRVQWLVQLERSSKLRKEKAGDTRRIQHEADYSDSML